MMPAQRWTTVIVTGRYEELATDPTQPEKPERAYALLKRRPVWWEQVMWRLPFMTMSGHCKRFTSEWSSTMSAAIVVYQTPCLNRIVPNRTNEAA